MHPDIQPGDLRPLLEVRDVVKRYGGVSALKGVGVGIARGTIHGLLGENGAGKSTLVRIIAGLTRATEGSVILDGDDVGHADVRSMEGRGVFLVTQEPMIVDQLTVADNLVLGRWPRKNGFVRDRSMFAQAEEFLHDARLDPRAPAATLSPVDKRKLNIFRALHSGGKLIILDEPTTALTMADKAQLFDFMRRLRAQGVSFLFISHYNEEILEVCDEVSVLRDGNMVARNEGIRHLDSDALSSLVIGESVELFHRSARATPPATTWSLQRITAPGLHIERLDLAAGEIIGFAGLPGSGARELGRALFGLLRSARGSLADGKVHHMLPRTPNDALKHGIAFLSEDRLRDGIVAIQSVAENMSLSSLGHLSRFGIMSPRAEQALFSRLAGLFSIKTSSPAARVSGLSGGNQQKVLLSRLLAGKPRLVILNEPTRGIDVGVKEEVHRFVDALTNDGVTVIVLTSDIDEMLRMTDRIAFFVGGRLIDIQSSRALTKEDVFERAFSVAGAPGADVAVRLKGNSP